MLGAEHSDTLMSDNNIATVLHAQGEFAPTLLAMAQTQPELTVRDAQAQSGGGSLTVRDGAVERAGPVEGVRLPDFMPAAVSCAYTCVMQIMS